MVLQKRKVPGLVFAVVSMFRVYKAPNTDINKREGPDAT
jgi:hypothetical protein